MSFNFSCYVKKYSSITSLFPRLAFPIPKLDPAWKEDFAEVSKN